MIITAKRELEEIYDICLTIPDKMVAISILQDQIDKRLAVNSFRRYRLPLLAERQVLDEYMQILQNAYEYSRIGEKDEDNV